MKDQYFGDVNDYRKYGVIRLITGLGTLETAVCWALTPGDSRSDGCQTIYLEQPDVWRHYDVTVFEHLREEVLKRGRKEVASIQTGDVLPNCRFFSEPLVDDEDGRREYFNDFFSRAKGADIVFFDPDNGLEVKSVPLGSRNSSKYIYEIELLDAFQRGHSILVYQHFPREQHQPFIRRLVKRYGSCLAVDRVYSFTTSHVVFLLFPQSKHLPELETYSRRVASVWAGQIEVESHRVRGGLPKGRPTPSPASGPMLRESSRLDDMGGGEGANHDAGGQEPEVGSLQGEALRERDHNPRIDRVNGTQVLDDVGSSSLGFRVPVVLTSVLRGRVR